MWPPAAASPRQGPCRGRSTHWAGTIQHLELRDGWSGLGMGWASPGQEQPPAAAPGTQLVTGVGAGLEALALSLEVVPVATAATVDELLTLMAGGVEEEAAEKCLAVPTDRGQVAEICTAKGLELSWGWDRDTAGLSAPRLPREVHTAPVPLTTEPFPPATDSVPTCPTAPHTSSPGAPPWHSVVPPGSARPGTGAPQRTPFLVYLAHPCAHHAATPEPHRFSKEPSPITGSWHV